MVKKTTPRKSAKSAATAKAVKPAKTSAASKPAKPAKPSKAAAPASRAKRAAATAVAPKTPLAVVSAPKPVVSAPVLKKKELIERVVETSGMKKKDVKPAVEAMLTVLGRAIADGEDLNLQPLGKLMVKNRNEKPNGTVLNCRLRQAKTTGEGAMGGKTGGDSADTATSGADPLAVPAKEGY